MTLLVAYYTMLFNPLRMYYETCGDVGGCMKWITSPNPHFPQILLSAVLKFMSKALFSVPDYLDNRNIYNTIQLTILTFHDRIIRLSETLSFRTQAVQWLSGCTGGQWFEVRLPNRSLVGRQSTPNFSSHRQSVALLSS